MRLGVCLVVVSLVLGLVSPPKAEAFALTTTAGVVALVGGFLAACGLPFLVKGMNESGLTESVGRLLQEYFTAENIEGSLLDWAGSVPLTVISGKLIIPRLLSQKLTAFAQWVREQYGAQAGENIIYNNPVMTGKFIDGSLCHFAKFQGGGYHPYSFDVPADVTQFSFDTWYKSENGVNFGLFFKETFLGGNQIYLRHLVGEGSFEDVPFPSYGMSVNGLSLDGYFIAFNLDEDKEMYSFLPFFLTTSGEYKEFRSFLPEGVFSISSVGSSDLAIDRAESVTIPGELAEGRDLALDVGAVEGMEIQEILQGILDAILAGDLAASAEAVEAQPEQPPEEDIKDIDGLGLPALGAALITRFPFSIPWDIAKGIKLLAAPAKAPYFEVDFFAPIADRVGGWQGSTKIVLDFSQFEILGQLSRWTSTVGFCLMLAGATKRFIWTA